MSAPMIVGGCTLLHGDMLQVLPTVDAESFHACVTDAPYHLTSITKRFGKDGSAPAKFGKDGAYARLSKGFMSKSWDGGDIAFRPETWSGVSRVLKPGAFVLAFASSRGFHRMGVAMEDAGLVMHPFMGWLTASGFPKGKAVGLPEWEGWRYGQQAIKPCLEPILVAQKPYAGRPVDSIRERECGAFNIDGCRVPAASGDRVSYGLDGNEGSPTALVYGDRKRVGYERPGAGRYPAQLIHDGSEPVLAEFAKHDGRVHGAGHADYSGKRGRYAASSYEIASGETELYRYGDSGSIARFFERCEFSPDDFPPFLYEPKVKGGERDDFNTHATLKPWKLVAQLVKLVTREGQNVLDPFLGSGTTALACERTGRKCVGIELEAEHHAIAVRRLREDAPLFAGAAA